MKWAFRLPNPNALILSRLHNQAASGFSRRLASRMKLSVIQHGKIWRKHPAAIASLGASNGNHPIRVSQNIDKFAVVHIAMGLWLITTVSKGSSDRL